MTRAVTVPGSGLMGAGIARSLVPAGLTVTVWNRHEDRARPLEHDGATMAADPVSAVAGAAAKVIDTLMATLRHLFGAASEGGHGDRDLAAVLPALGQD